MDEATKAALNAFVQQAITAANVAGQWSAEQAPLLVQEWLAWQLAASLAWGAVGLLLTAAVAYAAVWCFRQKRAHPNSDWEIGGVIFAVCACLPAVIVVAAAFDVVKVLVAPRVVVIEQLGQWLR